MLGSCIWDTVKRLTKLVCPSDIDPVLLFCIGMNNTTPYGDLNSIKSDCGGQGHGTQVVFLILLMRGRAVELSCMSSIVSAEGFNKKTFGFMVMGASSRIEDGLEEMRSI